jgi:hypothetical protein
LGKKRNHKPPEKIVVAVVSNAVVAVADNAVVAEVVNRPAANVSPGRRVRKRQRDRNSRKVASVRKNRQKRPAKQLLKSNSQPHRQVANNSKVASVADVVVLVVAVAVVVVAASARHRPTVLQQKAAIPSRLPPVKPSLPLPAKLKQHQQTNLRQNL